MGVCGVRASWYGLGWCIGMYSAGAGWGKDKVKCHGHNSTHIHRNPVRHEKVKNISEGASSPKLVGAIALKGTLFTVVLRWRLSTSKFEG